MAYTVQENANVRFRALESEFFNFKNAYKDLSTYINPTRGIFDNDRSKIGKAIDHKTLISSYGTHALRIFASGLNSGMTSKSSQWFRLTLDESAYLEEMGVREWLDEVQSRMYAVLNKSNLYDAFYNTYEELGQFGTGCFIILDDYEDVIRARSFTAGEYMLAVNSKGRVDTFAREFKMTVRQMVQEFGLESCSYTVRGYYNNNQKELLITIRHLIEPNTDRQVSKQDNTNMAYRSVYWESGQSTQTFLANRGYKNFRVIAPRWEVPTTDMSYGYGAGHHSMGAIKELQKTRKDKIISQEKLHNPPVVQSGGVDGHTNLLPGGVTKTSSTEQNAGVRPAYQVNPMLESFVQAIEELKEEIDRFFFVNLFLMLANLEGTNRTATEIDERKQEKIMMMGQPLHRCDEELLSPTLEIVFAIMYDAGMIPEPPEAIQGMPIKVEYTSILAQAQKSLGITKIERVVGFAGNMAQFFPEVIDNIDADEVIRIVNDLEGAPAKTLKERAFVGAIREQRTKDMATQQNIAAAATAADSAKKMATAPMDTDNALTRLMKSMPNAKQPA